MLIFHKMSEIITDDVILDISNKLAAKGNAIFPEIGGPQSLQLNQTQKRRAIWWTLL
jgi:hypothetical protein